MNAQPWNPRFLRPSVRRLAACCAGLLATPLALAIEVPLGAPVGGAEAGYAVAVGGARLAYGAPGETADAGAAYVAECVDEVCAAPQRVVPAGLEARDLYGFALALDGDTLAVGAPGDREGAVYLFVRAGGTWVQQAKLRPFDGRNGDEFGAALDLEGDRIVVGARGADDDRGAAYVFLRSGGAWALDARLQPAGLVERSRFAHDVALSADTIVAGAPFVRGAGDGWARGAAFVYARGAGWAQQAQLPSGSVANGAQFGFSVDIEGERAVVGAPGGDGFRGTVQVFERSGATWSQAALLTATGLQPGHAFGWSLALDGPRLRIGTPFFAAGAAACGRLHGFDLVGGSWTEVTPIPSLLVQPRETGAFAVASRGGRLALGLPGQDRGGVALSGGVRWYDPARYAFGDGYESAPAACAPPA